MPENRHAALLTEGHPLKEPVDPGLGELGESSWETDLWDAFLPDDGPEPQPEQGDFWIERGIE